MRAEREPADVLVVTRDLKLAELLCELLPAPYFGPPDIAANCGEARRILAKHEKEPDVIIVNSPLPDESGVDFAVECTALTASGIVLLTAAERYAEVAYAVEQSGVMAVAKPVSRASLYTAARLAAATHARLAGARRQNESLREKMAEIRAVGRAKLLLISRLGMTEEQAHRYVEKRAMDMRITRREVAEGIIRTYDGA